MANLRDISGQRQIVELALPQWLPDYPTFKNPGFPNCENLVPADTGLYRPFPTMEIVSNNSLTDLVPEVTLPTGQLFGARSTSGRFYYTAATDPVADEMHLFQYDESTNNWEDVTPDTPQGFNSNDHAYFDVFGTRVYVASSLGQRIMAKDIASGGQFAEISGAPSARDLVVTRGFLMGIQHEFGEGGTVVRDGVTWSGVGNPENWPNPFTDPIDSLAVLRGRLQLVGGGKLQRIIAGINGADAIIFGETKIWRVTFIGAPSVWDFQIVSHEEGTPAPTSVVASSDFIYFLGRRGWMRTNGAGVEPVGAGKVNRAFIDNDVLDRRFQLDGSGLLSANLGLRAAASAEPFNDHFVMWTYQAATDSTLSDIVTDGGDRIVTSDGDAIQAVTKSTINDTILMLNEITNSWGNAKIQLPLIGRVETDDTRSAAARFAALDADFNLVVASTSDFLDSFIETAENTGPANNRVTVRRVWPFVDSENCTVSVLSRESLYGVADVSPARTLEDDAAAPADISGRFIAIRLDLPGDDDWTSLVGMDAEFSDQGLGGLR